jgi:CheY-like chemotaxis protein
MWSNGRVTCQALTGERKEKSIMANRTEHAQQWARDVAEKATQEDPNAVAGKQTDERATKTTALTDRQLILVVEDNPDLLEVLGMLLDFEQYQVALTADGQEALDWLAHQRPALMILDWRLPTVGGGTVLAKTRAQYGATVPVLVLSAVADSEEARQAGADAYIRKPYAIEQLVDTIHRIIAA